MLNGASSEAIATMAEGFFGLVWGVIIGFYFSWRVALVALALTPLMTIGGAVQAKIDKQDNFKNKESKEADLLANDCIANYRTVSSFGVRDKIVDEFRELMETPFN
jgi:ABC-type bacteriocin/lantibiotic exporter with double-glycine peptidase domain